MFTLITATVAMMAPPQEILRKGIEVPNAIVKQHNAYVRCQDEHFDPTKIQDQASFAVEVEKVIADCSGQKLMLMQEADNILGSTSEYRDPTKRQDAIAQSFDGYDEMRRAMAPTVQPK